jgi:hypothetical protein
MRSYNQLIAAAKKPTEVKIDISKLISSRRSMPVAIVKKGIKQGHLSINGKPFHFHEIAIKPTTNSIMFQGISVDIEHLKKQNEFDRFIEIVLQELEGIDLHSLKASSKKPFCCYIVAYFANNPLDEVVESKSQYFDEAVNELEIFYRDHIKEPKDNKIPRRKELIELLVHQRTESFDELQGLVTNLSDGVFTNSLYKFLQEYTKATNKAIFQNLIAPLHSTSVYSRAAIEALIKPVHDAKSIKEIEEKFLHFENTQNIYTAYLNLLDNKNKLHNKIYKPVANFIFKLLKEECETSETKSAEINVTPTARKYNFTNIDRHEYDLFLNIANSGEGLGREITIYSTSPIFDFNSYPVGILKPGESREFSIPAKLTSTVTKPILQIKCSWIDLSGSKKERSITINFQIQNANIPWDELERKKPYTIQEIDDKSKLYGRDEILKELELNILSDKIESYKIWGQKRVGKSSIVKTLKSLFNNNHETIVIWRSIGGLHNPNPTVTLNTLGESLCSEIFEEIDKKKFNAVIKESLRAIPIPEFNGSLFPLESYIKKLRRIDSELRFIFIIDEFDRINEEFFLPGNLGDSFSLNIGKGLNSLSYVGFILVGSENMHLLDRQEINYNSFQNREVDTFNKNTEFDSFKKIIVGPVHPYITYSTEAVEKIYEVTNGNPYFANLICANVFNFSSKLKDNEVDINIVSKAISLIVNSYQKSHFEHFWSDGITEDSTVKKERKADIRRRLLVSYSLCFFQTQTFPAKNEIIRNFKKPMEYDVETYEIENTITEFYNRKIFFDENNVIRIRPFLFEQWLCGQGRTLIIEGISDLEALHREKQLEAEHALKNEELQRVSENLIFKGQKKVVSELRNYFNQFGNPFEQRRIYNLIDSAFYVSKNEIIDFFKHEQRNLFRETELEIKSNAKSPYREDVEVYSFPDTINENIEIFETFKLFTLIRKAKTLKNINANKDAWKNSGAKDIIIYESVIDSFSTIQQHLISFFDEKIISEKVPVKLVALVVTSKAKADIIRATSGFPNFRLINMREVDESKIKPFIDTTEVFENVEESRFAFAEVKKHCHDTSKESLNILFETHCPGKSIPIYWHSTKQFKPIFPNPNGIFYKEIKQEDGELYRDRIYQANKALIQTLNPFLINHIKSKATKDGKDDWFIADYMPRGVMEKIVQKWIEEGTTKPKESYFDLIHYKEIIKKNKELLPVFQMTEGGGDGLNWIDKVNELRRDPAHPEKPPPTLQQAQYFEQKKDEVINRISSYKAVNPD